MSKLLLGCNWQEHLDKKDHFFIYVFDVGNKKQTQQPTCSSDLNKGTENVREQNVKAQGKKLYDNTHHLFAHPNPNINELPPAIPGPHHL